MRQGWLAAATLLVAAACSGEPPAVITLDTTTTLVPIVRPSTSSTVPTTTAPTTTSIVETTTTLPDGITLTFAQPGTPEAEVEIAVRLAEAAYLEAVRAPPNPSHPGIAGTRTPSQSETLRANIQTLLNEGWAVRRSSDDQYELTVIFIELLSADLARVETCYLDDLVVYRPDTGEVVNDLVQSRFIVQTFERSSGKFKLASAEEELASDGISGCVAVLP